MLPIHTIHILKAIVTAVNLAYLGTLYVYPVTRPFFPNILGINWQYSLKPCLVTGKQQQQKFAKNDSFVIEFVEILLINSTLLSKLTEVIVTATLQFKPRNVTCHILLLT